MKALREPPRPPAKWMDDFIEEAAAQPERADTHRVANEGVRHHPGAGLDRASVRAR